MRYLCALISPSHRLGTYKVLVLYLDRPLLNDEGGAGLDGAVQIQRLEGSRFLRGRCSMGVGWASFGLMGCWQPFFEVAGGSGSSLGWICCAPTGSLGSVVTRLSKVRAV